jgi:endonuclease/exonuclease/phosphatase family metal-dependent hydrolase
MPYGALIDTRLRVVTWNLWWRFGPWEQRIPAITATLAALDPDIVALQEVWDDGTRNLAAELGAALGYDHAYDAFLELDGVRFGNAVLARWPIVGQKARPLPAGDQVDEQRLVLRADVDGPRGGLQIFSTHLNWRFDHGHIRQEQVRAVTDFVADSRPERTYPAVLCGDFNAEPDSDEIRALTGRAAVPTPKVVFHDAWDVGGDGQLGATWSNTNPYAARALEPDRRIDYVLVGWPRRGGAGHVLDAQVVGREPVDGVWPSDHFGVMAELRY